MSTASTCLAPLDSAIATSEPEPAPTISTLFSGLPRGAARTATRVLRLAPAAAGWRVPHDLVRHAVDRDVGQRRAARRSGRRCGPCSTATRRCRGSSVSTSSAADHGQAPQAAGQVPLPRRRSAPRRPTATTTPHTTDGARRNDSSGERRRCRSASRSGPSGRPSSGRSCGEAPADDLGRAGQSRPRPARRSSAAPARPAGRWCCSEVK